MIHVLIAVGIAGVIIGSTITLAVMGLMMGACPDSPEKRKRDWEALQEHRKERK